MINNNVRHVCMVNKKAVLVLKTQREAK